jgi:GT2 family glycosyltransferase
MEDVDFSKRAHDVGFKRHYLASTRLYHKGGGASEQVKATRLFYSLRSRIIYVCKHLMLPSAMIVTLTILFVEPFIRILHAVIFWSPQHMHEIFQAYFMLWRGMPQILRTIKDMRGTPKSAV